MAQVEHIQRVMTELGPVDDAIGLIDQLGDDQWLVVYDDDTAVEIECDETGNKLVFSMSLGPVSDQRKKLLHEVMLTWNYLYHDTGGMRLAVEGAEGNVVLLVDLCHLDIDVGTLAGFLEAFVETGRGWREVLQQDAPADEGERPAGAIVV